MEYYKPSVVHPTRYMGHPLPFAESLPYLVKYGEIPIGTHSYSLGIISPSSEWRPPHPAHRNSSPLCRAAFILSQICLSTNWYPLVQLGVH